MTNEQIEAIRQRWQATTAGEWITTAGDDRSVYESAVVTLQGDYISPDARLFTLFDLDGTADNLTAADLVFIAAAHQDIPALLDEIKQLRFKLDHANNLINVMCDPAFGEAQP